MVKERDTVYAVASRFAVLADFAGASHMRQISVSFCASSNLSPEETLIIRFLQRLLLRLEVVPLSRSAGENPADNRI
ncbi:MAG: hypothetical protein CME39_11695 [Haliea sp.]|nr:hypothetical protein [Haliea sp.]|tara:strand:+ start:470 stop:700 length:231 start_codon:yes stop_codon:yes gene_type:complete